MCFFHCFYAFFMPFLCLFSAFLVVFYRHFTAKWVLPIHSNSYGCPTCITPPANPPNPLSTSLRASFALPSFAPQPEALPRCPYRLMRGFLRMCLVGVFPCFFLQIKRTLRILRMVSGLRLALQEKSFIIIAMAQTLEELNALLAAVDEAIAKLMSGERVTRISHGDRMSEYGQAKLGDLQDYKSSLIAEINAYSNKPRHFRISTSKGV